MLKHSKWKNQNPSKVIRKREFKDWLIKQLQKTVIKEGGE